jgi:hypothetical protein
VIGVSVPDMGCLEQHLENVTNFAILNQNTYKPSQKRNMGQGQGRSEKATGGILDIFRGLAFCF